MSVWITGLHSITIRRKRCYKLEVRLVCRSDIMLCYVMLCYVMLCYVMLCYVMLCYVMLCYGKYGKKGLNC